MKEYPIPTAQEQLGFIQGVQRILEDGEFTATYKYALLLALADGKHKHPLGMAAWWTEARRQDHQELRYGNWLWHETVLPGDGFL